MLIWTHFDSVRVLMLDGMSNCLLDHGGSHIFLDQVILACINFLLMGSNGNVHMHIHHLPECRYNDHPDLIRLQILQHVPNHRWKPNWISSRGARNWTSPIAHAQRWWYFKLGFLLWFCFTRWWGSRGPACSQWYWGTANNRRGKHQ